MSFDVAIFDMQATGITTRADFTQWYEKFTDWTAGRDYSVGIDGIYAAVSYSQAEEFLAEVMKLAPQFEVGFCLNGDPEALATPDGNLIKQ